MPYKSSGAIFTYGCGARTCHFTRDNHIYTLTFGNICSGLIWQHILAHSSHFVPQPNLKDFPYSKPVLTSELLSFYADNYGK